MTYLQIIADDRPCIFLRGNHEQWAIDTPSGNPCDNMQWFDNGGNQTYRSYDGPMEEHHLEFIRNTKLYHDTDDYIFVHAGLRLGKSIDENDAKTLMWIRNDFLISDYDWGKLIIHGHTPTYNGEPEIRQNRICIDTGAAYGGKLTAVLLPEMEFIFARN